MPVIDRKSRLLDRIWPLLVAGLLLVQPILAWISIQDKSPTFDEPYEISIGFDAWINGSQRWDFNHPSFGRRLASAPLLLLDVSLPEDVTNQGDLAYKFIYENGVPPETIFRSSHLIMLLSAVLLGAGVYLWGKELFGRTAGLLSLALMALDPNLAANASIARPDVLFAAAFLWTVYLWWRFSQRSSRRRAAAAGIALGIALSIQYSGLILLPVMLVLYLLTREGLQLPLALGAIGLAALAVFVFLGMEFISVAEFAEEQASLRGLPSGGPLPVWARQKLPYLRYIYGLWTLTQRAIEGRPVFLMGKVYSGGTILYLPTAFLLKTPAPVLIATGLAIVGARHRDGRLNRRNVLFLVVPPVAYAVAILLAGSVAAYRHLLPLLPFIYLWLGQLFWPLRSREWRIILGALVVWMVVENATAYPNYLTYSNLIIGGPPAVHRYLVDSDSDWGQELPALERFQRKNQTGPINLSYFGTADPGYFGIEYRCLPGYGRIGCPTASMPTTGWIAVSATCLRGLCGVTPDYYSGLDPEQADAVLGNSIFVFRLE